MGSEPSRGSSLDTRAFCCRINEGCLIFALPHEFLRSHKPRRSGFLFGDIFCLLGKGSRCKLYKPVLAHVLVFLLSVAPPPHGSLKWCTLQQEVAVQARQGPGLGITYFDSSHLCYWGALKCDLSFRNGKPVISQEK